MELEILSDFFLRALVLSCVFSALLLVPGFFVAFVASLLQAATSIQDQLLGFVPKLFVVSAVAYCSSGWMLDQLEGFTADVMEAFARSDGSQRLMTEP